MSYAIYKQQQSKNSDRKHNKRIMPSYFKNLPVRFSRKQIISVLRELPEKERLVVFLVDIRQLGVEKTAEIMNKPITTVISETKRARTLVKKILLSNYQKIDRLRAQKMSV
jgi:DNA-directed RNA polymerase specialized sigma24 family protein